MADRVMFLVKYVRLRLQLYESFGLESVCLLPSPPMTSREDKSNFLHTRLPLQKLTTLKYKSYTLINA